MMVPTSHSVMFRQSYTVTPMNKFSKGTEGCIASLRSGLCLNPQSAGCELDTYQMPLQRILDLSYISIWKTVVCEYV